jgi:hypothetical protein
LANLVFSKLPQIFKSPEKNKFSISSGLANQRLDLQTLPNRNPKSQNQNRLHSFRNFDSHRLQRGLVKAATRNIGDAIKTARLTSFSSAMIL